jgi:hypothetical protein
MLTNAVSGLARSGVTRAGYPVLLGATVPLYALSNVARSSATRSNYTSSKPFISVGGIPRGWGRIAGHGGILAESLTKSDQLSGTPDTLTFTAYGWVPVEGADVILTRGSVNNLRRYFGGTVLSTQHRYAGKPAAANMLYDVSCIDYTWGLNWFKVSGNFTQASVVGIVASLMTYASGYTWLVDPDIGAAIIDQITFTEQSLSAALTQLVRRVGGEYQCDYLKCVHVFYTDTMTTAPTVVNTVHPTLATIHWTRDLSQVATRVLGSFGGANALEAIAPGETKLPVETAAWYLPHGGTVLVGQQRVTYDGLDGGGGGSIVGPGASPTGAPTVVVLPGAGVDVGSHDYAVTFTTASGESIAGPRLTVPVSVFLAPPTAPTAGAPGPGTTGPDPGVHDYAVSFVINTGETTPGPRVSISTGLTPPPTTAPRPEATAGPGPDPGSHDYAVAFVTATGETSPGPIGGQTTTATTVPTPASAPNVASSTTGGGLDGGTHDYVVTFGTAAGETLPGPSTIPITVALLFPPPSETPGVGQSTYTYYNPPPHRLTAGATYRYGYTFVTSGGETTMSPPSAGIVADATYGVELHLTYAGWGLGVSQVNYYRSVNGGAFHLFQSWSGSFPGLVYDLYTGDVDIATAATPPVTNTAGTGVGILTAIPVGMTGVTSRRLYRRFNGAGPFKLVTTIADNTTTGYTDTKSNAALGATAPTVNTAGGARTVVLTTIEVGTAAGGATARKLYRRSGGAGLRLLATIADNTTTTYTDTTPNASLGAAPPSVNTAVLRRLSLSNLPIGNSIVLSRKIYRTPANTGGGTLKLVATVPDNITTTFLDTVNDAALGAAALTVGTAQAQQVQLSAIPLGAPAVTARKVYRTKAGVSQLQLLTTIPDNVTDTYLDVKADASLGANVPTTDTSALAQPDGYVFAGSPSLPCASVAAFHAAGGWVIAGAQMIRYTGLSGSTLIGIPATGPGAIGAALNYNTTVVAAAMLTGIPASGLGAIKYQVRKGDQVNLWVQVDNLAAQAAVRAQIPGSSGIIEDEITDGRLSYREGVDRCQARLDLVSTLDVDGHVGIISVQYVCRDLNSQSGTTVSIRLGPPINLYGDFLIQRVNVARFHIPNLNPTYTVEASSLRFSAEEMLRLLRGGA